MALDDAAAMDGSEGVSAGRRNLVPAIAEKLRERIFASEPDTQIGSLPDLARALGVGIVTVQQAARILEHEGLLEVRRGPGGGYYGRRPDAAVLERSLAAYMRTRPASWPEALDMTSLLFNELAAAAARCDNADLHAELRSFAASIDGFDSEEEMLALEEQFQDLLFRMVNRPLFELLTRVTLRFSAGLRGDGRDHRAFAARHWKDGRRRIIDAILRQDEELARFEANRSNRATVLALAEREER